MVVEVNQMVFLRTVCLLQSLLVKLKCSVLERKEGVPFVCLWVSDSVRQINFKKSSCPLSQRENEGVILVLYVCVLIWICFHIHTFGAQRGVTTMASNETYRF